MLLFTLSFIAAISDEISAKIILITIIRFVLTIIIILLGMFFTMDYENVNSILCFKW